MYTFVRVTKLTDIGGRSAYITNTTGKHKEEDVLCIGGTVEDWKPYHTYEQTHQRSSEKNNEGRELIVALPNAWGGGLSKLILQSRVDKLAQKLICKNTDYQFAVHWNGSHTNLHAHIIFSEREKRSQTNAKGSTSDFYDRDIYLTQDGKVARKKAARAVNKDGSEKPPIHRKGEQKKSEHDFTIKDKKYKSKEWLQEVKKTVHHTFFLESDKKHTSNYLHTFHEGKSPESSAKIRELNQCIRTMNQYLDNLKTEGYKLKKIGDKAYNELYTQYLKDFTLDNEWLEENIILNSDKINAKIESKLEKEHKSALKAREKEQQQKEFAEYFVERYIDEEVYKAAHSCGYLYESQLDLEEKLRADMIKQQPKLEKQVKKTAMTISKAEEIIGKNRVIEIINLKVVKYQKQCPEYSGTFTQNFDKLIKRLGSLCTVMTIERAAAERERKRKQDETKQRESYLQKQKEQKKQLEQQTKPIVKTDPILNKTKRGDYGSR